MAFIVSTFLFSPFKVVDTSNTIEAFHIGDTVTRNIISCFSPFHLLRFSKGNPPHNSLQHHWRTISPILYIISLGGNCSQSIAHGMSKCINNESSHKYLYN